MAHLQDFLKAWPEGARLLLLHGYDTAGSQDSADLVCRALADPGNPAGLERFTSEQISADPQALVAAITGFSMFGGQTIVRVDGADDRTAPALAMALDGPAGNPLLVVAGGLKKTSALLALAAKHAGVVAIESRTLSPAQMAGTVRDMAAALGMRCEPDAAQALVAATGSDRVLLRSELEKLALYLDAAPDRMQPLDNATVHAIAAGVDVFDHAGLVMGALGGRAEAVVAGLAQMPTGEGVVALRILGGRLATLAEMRTRVEAGTGAEAAVEAMRPPVFWKEKPLWVAAVRRWSSAGLSAALRAVLKAEMALKARGGLGDLEAQALLLRVAKGR